MKLLSLNCRGLGNPDAVGGLKNLVRRVAPTFIFLCETKLNSENMRKVKRRLDGYDGLEVDSEGRSEGLALLWKKEVNCSLRSVTNHYIDVTVRHDDLRWRLTGFYGWPATQDRHLSWQQLRLLAEEGPDPWICIGDFNEIHYANEMLGGSRQQWQMNNFRDVVDECGLQDIPYEGYAYTYDNGQAGSNNRQCRLDRAMVTGRWLDLFPFSKLFHFNREWSDHAPICVHIAIRREEAEKP
ncbi:uncharacterized protein LOC141627587 [Silene latifolia]|uniref:uncharacterized protein LOC141627587 n=1 Tax=Silene latifolia TaxID=37657 RepID=UPI003D781221